LSAPKADFESLLSRLERSMAQLAEGTAPLDELVAAYAGAQGLLAEAEEQLEALKTQADALARSLSE
jgi:exodeoxyribonuclease VII small subunit